MKAVKLEDMLLLRLVRGEEIVDCLKHFVRLRTIPGGTLTGLGAADTMTVAFYDVGKREYRNQRHEGLIEIMSLTGNLSWYEGEPLVHVHVSAAEETAGAFGGHLVEARVSASVEICILPANIRVSRALDREIGLPLLDFPDIGQV